MGGVSFGRGGCARCKYLCLCLYLTFVVTLWISLLGYPRLRKRCVNMCSVAV